MGQSDEQPKIMPPQVLLNYNQLTPVETECLAILAEEAGKLASAAAKTIRHGKTSTCDGKDYNNLREVVKEFADVLAAMSVCVYNGVLNQTVGDVADMQHVKITKLKNYVHHAKLPPTGR